MLIDQNIGSWILDEMETLHREVRLFGEMIAQVEDFSKLIELYEDKISLPLHRLILKSS